MCGEMASEAAYVPILLGLGLDELSMNVFYIPKIKNVIRNTSLEESKVFLDKLLGLDDMSQIKKLVRDKIRQEFSEEFPSMEEILSN
jgi:phosphotransferase system enzyme I (PtsI)